MTRTATRLAVAACLILAGCGEAPPPLAGDATPRMVTAAAAPADGLWVGLRSQAEHRSPVGHAPQIGWVPITRIADEGSEVKPGDELVHFAEDVMRDWNANDAFMIQRDDLRRKLDLLNADGGIAGLQARIRSLAAQRRVLAAELAAAESVDPELVRIAELQLANVRSVHAAALRTRDRLEKLAAAGGAVSGVDLARAREDEVTARAAVAAPEVALELARLPASAATVRMLRLSVADLDAQLGDRPDEGLAAELRTAEERRVRRGIERGGSERRRREYEKRLAVIADPAIRSTAAGTVQLGDDGVEVGTKAPFGISIIFVLDRDGLAVRLRVPEGLRPLATPGSRVSLIVPGVPGGLLMGRLTTIAAAPMDDRDGRRSFPAQVLLDRIPEGLRPGMTAEARLLVAATGTPAVIPGFCVADPEDPQVVMADGSLRRLGGWAAAGSFVALTGLVPGERVQVPAGAPADAKQRFSAVVEPETATPVRLRSWGWQVLELVADGMPVKKGERIARLAKTEHWNPPEQVRADTDLALAQARLDLAVGQLAAADDRAQAQGDWIRASLASERTRIELRVGRLAFDPVAAARASEGVASAEVGLERARRELEAARTERAAGGIGDLGLRGYEQALASAGIAHERALLSAAADELGRDHVAMLGLIDADRNAADAENAARANRIIAGEQYRSALAVAAAGFESTARWIEGQLAGIADEELLAPQDGVLVHVPTWDGTPKVGRELRTMEPFRIATGRRLRATFELPARLFGSVSAGAKLVLRGPDQDQRIEADVVRVADAFLPPRDLADQLALGRNIGAEDRFFRLTVAFDPPGDLPPGTTVHADF